ncbi:STY4526/YPO1902 family pathogenicity island replication protein [Salinisphaera orenii]|uniref:STY4526/YPO1902 family pathogenicity island replication protein n=1 Tax=Salinisphaera orenii TaxID=856731 RepID=UPI0013A6857D
MSSKEHELTRAGLNYVMDCVRDGDWKALNNKGFGDRHIRVLQQVTLRDMSYLNQHISAQQVFVDLDPENLVMLVAQMQQISATEDLKHEMVRRDAPVDMMRQLFAMNGREYTAMRRALGRPANVGRPAQPDTDTMDAIWFAWEKHWGRHGQPATPSDWLELADSADVNLGIVWRFAQDLPPLESVP